jgi:hypothetical protein
MIAEIPSDEVLKKIKDVISNQSPKIENEEKKCPHYLGYLRKIKGNDLIPEECFLCPKLTKCVN